ncbi:hypothetical protein Poli38472_009500 [Pythium oligandrum]|uniref:Amino acid transporter transmembrane domain-containing protein n=1 Tax=Pythium oligandrum TaxID=41045 RepID=A0A8K1CH22_PYTOL|nr:hypothetical protein Poli38472_009500 [Pythium oligandrum]|eukprot:TMW62007.1 hypothetical protein Poli38472_009500 [Pythium oligandrum]
MVARGAETARLAHADGANMRYGSLEKTRPKAVPLASDAKTFVSAIISLLGSGVLGFPYAFKQTGILLGLVIIITIASITAFCMLLIVECKYKVKSRYGVTATTYGEIGRALMGAKGEWLVNSSLILAQVGFSVAYLLFISENVHAYFGIAKQLVIIFAVPPLVAFCLVKHIKHIAYIALCADIMLFTGLTVVYAVDFSYLKENSTTAENIVGVFSTIPFFFGVATYCFAGIGMALPLENSMAQKPHFMRVLVLAITLITFVYASFGVLGYLAFGDATLDVITLNIEGHGGVASVVKLCLCFGLLCACPIMLFPVFEVLQPLCLAPFGESELKIALFRASIVVLAAFLAAAAPSFGQLISFIGSTCCAFLGFVLPVVFYMKLSAQSLSLRAKVVLNSITALGLFMVFTGIYNAAANLF